MFQAMNNLRSIMYKIRVSFVYKMAMLRPALVQGNINVNKVIYSLMNIGRSKILINKFAQRFSNWLMFLVTWYID